MKPPVPAQNNDDIFNDRGGLRKKKRKPRRTQKQTERILLRTMALPTTTTKTKVFLLL